MATSSDIATLALKHLGVLAAGETSSAVDALECTQAYDRIYAEMQEEGFNVWASASVPDYLVDGLTRAVAARVRPVFMETAPQLHEAETLAADQHLKRMLRRKHTRAPVEIEDY